MTAIRSLVSILLFSLLVIFFAATVLLGLQHHPAFLPALLFAAILIGFSLLLPEKRISNPDLPFKDFKTIFLLAAITVLPRVFWIAGVHPSQVSDFRHYHQLATSLAGGSLKYQSYIRLFPHFLGYPFVLSAWYRLFGSQVLTAQLLNVVLFVGIVLGTYWLAGRFLDKRFAILAAVIVALWPSQLFYSTLVSTEALFTLLLIICIGLYTTIRNSNRWLSGIALFAALGSLIGVTNGIRPFGLLFLAAVFIDYFVFFTIPSGGIKTWLFKLTLYAFICLGYLMTSNLIHYLTVRSVQGSVARSFWGYSILVGSNVDSGGAWNPGDADMQNSLYQGGKVEPDQVDRILLRYAFERIATSPSAFLKLQLQKNQTMWQEDIYGIYWNAAYLDEGNPGFLSPFLDTLGSVSNIYYYTFLICCTLGSMCGLWKRENGLIALVGLIILGTILIFVFTEVQSRYHYYVLPLFSLLAVYGLSEVRQAYGRISWV